MDEQKKLAAKAILISALLVFVIAAYFIYLFIRQQKKIMAWQSLRIKAEIEYIENERKRIAGDLHDELGPVLSAVRLQINHLEPTEETDKMVLEKSNNQIDEVIKRFREISYNLLPNTLVRKGLVKATEEFADRMMASTKLQIKYTHTLAYRLAENREINVYRIIQEIVHNTVKHARATLLQINMQEQAGLLIITTTDDGVGFNYSEKSAAGGGLGLLSLQSRVEVLNGQLTVNSLPGMGTHFIIEIPTT
ncbi:MAG: hypothetical protein RIR12_442 [Bacteroidota bacterium]|jgi:signal transduction histidine kinase